MFYPYNTIWQTTSQQAVEHRVCPQCNGAGMVRRDWEPPHKCGRCGGSGIVTVVVLGGDR